jgi:predicted RNA methylase
MIEKTIDNNILSILEEAQITNNSLVLNSGQLDRKTYTEVDKVLKELGGKWNTKAKAHLFAGEDLETKIDEVLTYGKIVFAKDNGYFPTPAPLAKQLVAEAEIEGHMLVLEPSAGTGNLVREIIPFIQPRGRIVAVELNPKFAAQLKKDFNEPNQAVTVVEDDFMNYSTPVTFDRVVMNPPFERQQDIDHILQAFSYLKSGGILTAIMSPAYRYRTNKKSVIFRNWLVDMGGIENDNPEQAFKESGTLINTVRIKVVKP